MPGSNIRIEFELEEKDIDYFRMRLKKARDRHGTQSETEIVGAAQKLANQISGPNSPAFIAPQIEKLNAMIGMLQDAEWKMEGEDRAYVLNALVYFADPLDMIEDSIPGIGLLDDAIMIELAARELEPEMEAYRDFCANRDELKEGAPEADPIDVSRETLSKRMRRRRRRAMRGGGAGAPAPGYNLFRGML